jgi:ComF family protein
MIGNKIKDILWPKECLLCYKKDINSYLCPQCLSEIKINTYQECPKCKRPTALGKYCRDCRESKLMGIISATEYGHSEIKELIKAFKYTGASEVGQELGKIMIKFLTIFLEDAQVFYPQGLFPSGQTIIIPVPLSKKRFRSRGFNQSEVLAKILGEYFGWQISTDLIRIKHREPQADLTEEERRQNLHGVYKWTGQNLKNKKIIIIDDVTTTGTTFNEVAREIKKANPRVIYGLALAKG